MPPGSFNNQLAPPQNLEAERAILGACLQDSSCIGAAKKFVKSEYFYSGVHRLIWDAMNEQVERGPLDLVTLHDILDEKGLLEKAGGASALAELFDDMYSIVHVEYYAKLVWRTAVRRKMLHHAVNMGSEVHKSHDLKELVGNYVEAMRDVSEELAREEGVVDIIGSIEDVVAEYNQAKMCDGVDGISTGWLTLDRVTGGLHPGEVITIVARLGVGKTWCEALFLKRAWEQEERPLFISLEMDPKQIRKRFFAMVAGLSYSDFRMGRLGDLQEPKIAEAVEFIKSQDRPIHVIGADLIERVNDIDAYIDGLNPSVLYVDGFYLLEEDKKADMWAATTKIIRKLKRVAFRRGIPIVLTSQFNRGAAKKGGQGDVEDIGFTDAIGQTSDVVISLVRDEDMERNREMKIRCLKNREGVKVEFMVDWDLDRMEFDEREAEEEEAEEVVPF